MTTTATVTTAQELARALDEGVQDITVEGEIAGAPELTLPPGTALRGGTLVFGAKGLRLTSDNTLEDVTVRTSEQEAAIVNDTGVEDLGTLTLRRVRTRGQVALLAEDRVRAGHVRVEGLHVEAADVRGRIHRPHGFGVEAHQGGFTLWNRQRDPEAVLTAELLDLSAGSNEEPVRGSGIFVGGRGDWDGAPEGGTVRVSRLTTGEIHTDGGIPAGTPDLISGAVFVITGAVVEQVRNQGPVTTYGQNDMVLDNWGRVDEWIAEAPVTSHGPSGIGFVNFGDIRSLEVRAPITTTGKGARGFNLYDGSLESARFRSIATTGDGSIGVQVSKPLARLEVEEDVTTAGGEGLSLVRGVQTVLRAIALSVKEGGVVDSLRIGGRLATGGDDVTTLELLGEVKELTVAGGVEASGKNSDAARAVPAQRALVEELDLRSAHGQRLVEAEQN